MARVAVACDGTSSGTGRELRQNWSKAQKQKEYEPGRMSANDPRIISVRPEIPPDAAGRLYLCPSSPTSVMVHLVLADGATVRAPLNLAPYFA